MSTLDAFGRDFAGIELDPGEAADDYIPTETYRGSTRPFRAAPVVIARPATVVERPGPDGDFLAGFATGLALGIPIWFGLVMIAIAVAGR